MDAVDRIVAEDTMENNLNSWFVMETPDNLLQISLSKEGQSTDDIFTTRMNPAADYTGGDATTRPTSASGVEAIVFGTNDDVMDSPFRMNICGSDTAPYWVATMGTLPGTPGDGQISWAAIQLENLAAGVVCPWWVYVQEQGSFNSNALSTISGSSTDSRGMAQYAVDTVPVPIPAVTFERTASSQVVPGGIELDGNLAHLSFPIVFAANGPGHYIGTTEVMQWQGIVREKLTTFNAKTRISFGDVTFPWDGTTDPIP
jgi:hypothetical protein